MGHDTLTHIDLKASIANQIGNNPKIHEIPRWHSLHVRRNLPRKRLRGLLLAFWATQPSMGHDFSRNPPGNHRILADTIQQVKFTFLSRRRVLGNSVDALTILHKKRSPGENRTRILQCPRLRARCTFAVIFENFLPRFFTRVCQWARIVFISRNP